MDSITQLRLSVLRELKNVRKFLDMMEKNVKTRRPEHTLRAYTFLTILVEHMNEGDLTPFNVEFIQTMREHFGQEDTCYPDS
jgi:hypothetical protein